MDAIRILESVDGRDVRMVQRGEQVRFAAEPREPLHVAGKRVWQYFERDIAAEPRIVGPVDDPHAAGADFSADLVGADARARRQSHAISSTTAEYTEVRVRKNCNLSQRAVAQELRTSPPEAGFPRQFTQARLWLR